MGVISYGGYTVYSRNIGIDKNLFSAILNEYEGKYMNILLCCFILLGLFGSISCALLVLLFNITGQITAVNKQLLIVVAGKEAKPEALRALVASNKPPQKKLRGIANEKGKKKSPVNTDYTLVIGEKNGI